MLQVHCQGGKGRTGTFCSALLLWTGFCKTAEEALDVYARRRTDPRLGIRRPLQGVTSPAQVDPYIIPTDSPRCLKSTLN
jgi:hypothetical protein